MVPCRPCPVWLVALRFCWEPKGDLRLARDPLGLCLRVALIWPGPGEAETSLKSLVLLHFLWRPGRPELSEADIGLAGVRGPGPPRELRGPRGAGVVGEGEGAGDIELDPSVWMEEEEVYMLDLLSSLSLLLA